jgi:transposase InsO family protein
MPWKTVVAMDERMRFITRALEGDESFAQLCRQFGISRKTGYKWVERFELGGPAGLEERRSTAGRNAKVLPDDQVDAVVAVRREHPTWGPKKIRARLVELGQAAPSKSAIGDVLKRHGLVHPRRRRPHAPREFLGLTVGERPNDVWCVDFKGDFRLGDKTRCYPLTISDFYSRYLLRCTALESTKEESAIRVFEGVFQEFGLPEIIRSDNGVPFASTGVGGLTRLAIWWIKLGIVPERIEPGHPEQNGRHERMHRTMKAEATRPPGENLAAQQRLLDRFRHQYNDIRPHEAIGQKTPMSRYSVSRRAMPATLGSPTYEEPLLAKRLDDSGRLRVFGAKVTLTKLLAREEVGVEEHEDSSMTVYFGPLRLGEVRRKDKEVVFDRELSAPRPAILL